MCAAYLGALAPILVAIAQLREQIRAHERQLEALANSHTDSAALRPDASVGYKTASE